MKAFFSNFWVLTLLILTGCVGFSASEVFAQDNLEEDMAYINKLSASNPEECHEIFETLWKWAKQDEPSARGALLTYMTMIHGPAMQLPSFSRDNITRQRYYITLAVHAIKQDQEEDIFEYIDGFYQGVHGLGVKSDFGECMAEERSYNCVRLAVKNGAIPAFDAFAKEIDSFLDQGLKAQCPGANIEPANDILRNSND